MSQVTETSSNTRQTAREEATHTFMWVRINALCLIDLTLGALGAQSMEADVFMVFSGEAQGFRYIFQAVKDHTIASTAHYLVPPPNKPILPPDDYAFLQAKGAFDIESDELRGELIARYFEFAHPMLPVVDPAAFFRQYELEGPTRVSTLLLQSMFLVASSVSHRLHVFFGPFCANDMHL